KWLPWTNDPQRRKLRCWRTEPGILLFRPSENPTEHPALVVLLVGEMPTWGVRAAQLESALSWVDEFAAWESVGGAPRYQILGPTFATAGASLEAVLRRRPAKSTNAGATVGFTIASGSATGPRVRSEFSGAMNYQTATPTDDARLEQMLDFIFERGARCP